MVTGKCKKKSDAFISAQRLSSKKLKKRKEKLRKPVEARRTIVPGGPSSAEEAIDGLVEFFTSLNVQLQGIHAQENSVAENPIPGYEDSQTYGNQNDIQELEDMGALARDLILRIQRLRDQFIPGSLAARALPDIRVQDGTELASSVTLQEHMQTLTPDDGAMEIDVDAEELSNGDEVGERGSNTT